MKRYLFVVLIVTMGALSFPVLGAKTESLDLQAIRSTEQLLQLGKPELEKIVSQLNLEQKLALKKIAFNEGMDLKVRWRALILAAQLLGKEMRTDIAQASKSNDWFMRSAAMMAANEVSPDEAAILARKLIHDRALVVRSAAVDILGATGESSDRRLLWNIIRDPLNMRKGQSLWIRSQALQILAKTPLKVELPQFISMLNESDIELQAIAIHGLERASDFQFGSAQESIEDHRRRWLNWWETTGKTKSF